MNLTNKQTNKQTVLFRDEQYSGCMKRKKAKRDQRRHTGTTVAKIQSKLSTKKVPTALENQFEDKLFPENALEFFLSLLLLLLSLSFSVQEFKKSKIKKKYVFKQIQKKERKRGGERKIKNSITAIGEREKEEKRKKSKYQKRVHNGLGEQ